MKRHSTVQEGFFQWAYGNALDNATRGVIAEYLIHRAVGGIGTCRQNWDGFDVETESGIKIEVKASGYVQSWQQQKPSEIEFKIAKRDAWIASENRYLGRQCRYADVWIFCVHAERDRGRADPFDTDQWEFYIATSQWLDEVFGNQQRVRLSVLRGKGLTPLHYSQIAAAVQGMAKKSMP